MLRTNSIDHLSSQKPTIGAGLNADCDGGTQVPFIRDTFWRLVKFLIRDELVPPPPNFRTKGICLGVFTAVNAAHAVYNIPMPDTLKNKAEGWLANNLTNPGITTTPCY